MNILSQLADRGVLPDKLIRYGIRRLDERRLIEEGRTDLEDKHARFIDMMRHSPIAIHTDKANEQHYEMPPEFFQAVLGKHLKYSSCYWDPTTQTLDDAEARMLRMTVHRAGITDGMQILELGCGWGSLSLWMAEHYPSSRIVALSNSKPQGDFIRARAAERGVTNLTVHTADINHFSTDQTFDRVVSVEMFEHMRNWPYLLNRISQWLKPDGRLFIHIFTHTKYAYTFDLQTDDWMGQHFFTGGIMPSDDLLFRLQEQMQVEAHWKVNGRHYSQTAEAWLDNMDRRRDRILPLFKEVYGEKAAKLWFQRWRIFFMACAELWGYAGGQQWRVSHYLLKKRV